MHLLSHRVIVVCTGSCLSLNVQKRTYMDFQHGVCVCALMCT